MGTVKLPVKVEGTDHSVIGVQVELLGRDPFRVEGGVFVDVGHTEIVSELLFDLPTHHLEDPHLPNGLVIQVGLLLQCKKKFRGRSVTGNQYLDRFLKVMSYCL